MRPKITLVTTTLNAQEYLAKCIDSILNQNYPSLEFVVIDAGSTDNTARIVKSYGNSIAHFEIVPNIGLYAGIQHGFDRSSGDIMGWLNADDVLHPAALKTVADIFSDNEEIKWITGRPSFVDKHDRIFGVPKLGYKSRRRYLLGHYKWIQQESTFWRRDLWVQAKGLNCQLKYAGDFDLWLRFYTLEPLYLVNCLLGAFRQHSTDQISVRNRAAYYSEVSEIYRKFWAKRGSINRIGLYALGPIEIFLRPFAQKNRRICDLILQRLGLNRILGIAPKLKLDKTQGRFVQENLLKNS